MEMVFRIVPLDFIQSGQSKLCRHSLGSTKNLDLQQKAIITPPLANYCTTLVDTMTEEEPLEPQQQQQQQQQKQHPSTDPYFVQASFNQIMRIINDFENAPEVQGLTVPAHDVEVSVIRYSLGQIC